MNIHTKYMKLYYCDYAAHTQIYLNFAFGSQVQGQLIYERYRREGSQEVYEQMKHTIESYNFLYEENDDDEEVEEAERIIRRCNLFPPHPELLLHFPILPQ